MGPVLGTIAIMISLTALWFTVEVARRVDHRGDGMVRPHVRTLKARLAETNSRIGDLEARLSQLETRLVATHMESRAARDLAEETRSIRHGLRRSKNAMDRVHSYHA